MVQGPGPSARYAHTLALVANRFLVAMGGNDGKQTLADAWALDTSDKPYQWRKIVDAGDTPTARSTPLCMARCLRPDVHVMQNTICVPWSSLTQIAGFGACVHSTGCTN